MARRRKSSTFDDLFAVTLKIPLWANLLIACAIFVSLRIYVGSSAPMIITSSGNPGIAAAEYLGRVICFYSQFLIPPIFVLGGIVGSLKRKHKARKFHNISNSSDPGDAIRQLTWQDFERMTGEALRRLGFTVNETGKGPDGGVDLVLRKHGEIHLVQCKQWKAQRVGVQVVRELYGIMAARGAAGGFVVTSGDFTQEARKFASGTSIELVDGTKLTRWFTQFAKT
ncbi:restriction endonuclease [Pseudomonas sp. W22_MBD1_FP4]|uniref:restriction endonuclease n=1 Tax=Pseudomonas sp. W22_MBD1_FP4 TaxID=3240272 RepID=UPI003F982A71